jgi:hypothetical protein
LTDLDATRGPTHLREKGGTQRWQPVTPDLATALAEHAHHQGAVLPTDALLRFLHGGALSSRRYDHLRHRLGQQPPSVAAQGVSTHWLPHTTRPAERLVCGDGQHVVTLRTIKKAHPLMMLMSVGLGACIGCRVMAGRSVADRARLPGW